MADFAAHSSIEDWSLQAIVRGSSGDFTKFVGIEMDGSGDSFFGAYNHQKLDDRDFVASVPEFFDVSNGSSDELEDLYKPFYPIDQNYVPNSTVAQFQQKSTENNSTVAEEEDKKAHECDQASVDVSSARSDGYIPKYKRRKNQHKRVVIQVSAEGLSSDMWAWRKYGQKPIKGSPYPRSYYRCSSSKGCLARKQVEQSYTNPGMFIVTYTAEHNHSKPTRRNSLAGTVRQKFPSNQINNSNNVKQEKVEGSSRNSSPKAVNMEVITSSHDAIYSQVRIKQEAQGDHDRTHDDCDYDHTSFDYIANDDLMFNEDFFSGLEDFDDFISGSVPASYHASSQQFNIRS